MAIAQISWIKVASYEEYEDWKTGLVLGDGSPDGGRQMLRSIYIPGIEPLFKDEERYFLIHLIPGGDIWVTSAVDVEKDQMEALYRLWVAGVVE